MPFNEVDILLERLSEANAERLATWLLWALVVRRMAVALLLVVAGIHAAL